MKDHNFTLDQSIAANELTAKLVASGHDDFDLEVAREVNALAYRVCQHRNINPKAAKKIVSGFIEVKTK